jgi:phage baseplate assembly protein W
MQSEAGDKARAFLGVGWAFPPCPGEEGDVALARYEEDIRQAIRIILGTDRGERLMRPDFGAGLNAFVFEPLNQTTCHLVKTRVQEALTEWEPRIDVVKLDVRPGGVRNELSIELTYRVRGTNAMQNLVYPFYLLEGTSR